MSEKIKSRVVAALYDAPAPMPALEVLEATELLGGIWRISAIYAALAELEGDALVDSKWAASTGPGIPRRRLDWLTATGEDAARGEL